MLSYRHAFHAGNHADVLKHLSLVLCCLHLSKKDKPFCYLDTHAGAGMYNLNSEAAQKNQEYLTGVDKLMQSNSVPEAFKPYQALIRQARDLNPRAYPGSPWFAAQTLRAHDSLQLFELHPNDFQQLTRLFSRDKRVKTHNSDGYQSLKSLFPPPSRRGITLIDPPYEQEQEYQAVLATLREGIKRFNTGAYIVWYPLINRQASAKSSASEKMVKQIHTEFSQEQLHVQYIVDPAAKGMYGSGLAILNPPWGLQEQLQEALSFLCRNTGNPNSRFNLTMQAVNQNPRA